MWQSLPLKRETENLLKSRESHERKTFLKNLWMNNKLVFEQVEKCDTALCMNIIESQLFH